MIGFSLLLGLALARLIYLLLSGPSKQWLPGGFVLPPLVALALCTLPRAYDEAIVAAFAGFLAGLIAFGPPARTEGEN
jgi:hypothetical protein